MSVARAAQAVALSAGLLAWSNVVLPRSGWGPRRRTLANGALGLGLLAAGRGAGYNWRDLGLGAGDLGKGARWGLVAAGAPTAVIGAATWWNARSRSKQQGWELPPQELAEWVLFAIPVGTVLLEEVAFRSLLDALLRRGGSSLDPRFVGAVVFGLWHVAPARVARDPVLPTVMFTTAAGVVFSLLRHRTGSVAAPAVLHYAVNAVGAVASSRGLGKFA